MAVKGIKISELAVATPLQSGLIPISQNNETVALAFSAIAPNSTAFDTISANSLTVQGNTFSIGTIASRGCIKSDNNIITDSCFVSAGRELLAVVGDSVAQTLQQATDNGNTTTNSISVNNSITFTCNLVGGLSSQVSGDFSSSLGGRCNRVAGNCSIVGGGEFNVVRGDANVLIGSLSSKNYGGTGSVLIGGCNNVLSAVSPNCQAVAIGGYKNFVEARQATIIGGIQNKTTGYRSTIVGGFSSIIETGSDSFIGGGTENKAQGFRQFIGNGYRNHINSPGVNNNYSAIVGGCCNKMEGYTSNSFIGGGKFNIMKNSTNQGTIGGGFANYLCYANQSTIAGGRCNRVCDSKAFIGGGANNTIFKCGDHGTIGGGFSNTLSADYGRTAACYGTIAGGKSNFIQGGVSFIGGGTLNKIYQCGCCGVIGGGSCNEICANSIHASILGGTLNKVCGLCSTIGGGFNNYVGGDCSSILGGNNNSTLFSNSFIIGSGLGTDRDNYTMVNNLSAECKIFSACGSSCNISLLDGSGNTFVLSISGGLVYAVGEPDTGFDVLGVEEGSNNTLGSDATTQIRIAG